MIYQGLREGLRKAAKVEIFSYLQPETQDVMMEVRRHGKLLWWSRTARAALQTTMSIDYIQGEAFYNANFQIDQILDQVDWDTFFDHRDPFVKRLDEEVDIVRARALNAQVYGLLPDDFGFTGIRTETNLPTGDNR